MFCAFEFQWREGFCQLRNRLLPCLHMCSLFPRHWGKVRTAFWIRSDKLDNFLQTPFIICTGLVSSSHSVSNIGMVLSPLSFLLCFLSVKDQEVPRDWVHGTQMKIFIKGRSLFLQIWEAKWYCFKDTSVLKCTGHLRFDFHFLNEFFC